MIGLFWLYINYSRSISSEDTMSDEELTESLQQKYGGSVESEQYDYAESITISRKESIEKKIGFDIAASKWSENLQNEEQPMFKLFEDGQFEYPLELSMSYDKKEKEIVIEPAVQGMQILWDGLKTDTASKKWGNLGKYYLVQYIDLKTGEELEKPIITIVNVQAEIKEAPDIEFFTNEKGQGGFRWKEVEGADKYLIFSTEKRTGDNWNRGKFYNCHTEDVTEETSWTAEEITEGVHPITDKKIIVSMNQMFNTTSISEAREDYQYFKKTENKYFGVIAISTDGKLCSNVSNLYAIEDIAPLLVYKETSYKAMEKSSSYSVEEMPTHRWVVMCDGSLEQRLIEYDFSSVDKHSTDYSYYVKETGKIEKGTYEYFNIDYKIRGTMLNDSMLIGKYDKDTLEEDLKKIEKRQQELEMKSGDIDTYISIGEEENKSTNESGMVTVPKYMKYTANSAFCEYLEMQMMAHQEQIDISAWSEHYDMDKITDAFLEAEYQTPLILGISKMNISSDGTTLSITYEDDAKTYQKKRKQVEKKVTEIIDQIIQEDMSDLEKEIAINTYLCENITYDRKALENAKEKNMKETDKEYRDAFNVYGALINGKAVCAGYAGAFKLLADKAGLECIIVTGSLEGGLAHEWNKVRIEGKWQIIDVTNNDTQFYPNAMFNLSDEAAATVLVEDKRFALDEVVDKYQAITMEQEYYNVQNAYFDLERIADAIVEELKEKEVVNLRTEYTMTDNQFEKVMQKVEEKLPEEKLGAGYWIGVIRVEKN